MRGCFFCAAALAFAAFAGPARAAPIEGRYASVLRAFAPRLDAPAAAALARTTIREADAAGIDARLVVALVAIESNWNPAARSSAGARGLGQLMPATAAALGVDAFDANANLHGTVRMLRSLLDRYAGYAPQPRYERTLAAYNAGTGAVARAGGVPPFRETRRYVRAVIALWRRLAGL